VRIASQKSDRTIAKDGNYITWTQLCFFYSMHSHANRLKGRAFFVRSLQRKLLCANSRN